MMRTRNVIISHTVNLISPLDKPLISVSLCAGLFAACRMLRLRACAVELSPAVMESVSCRLFGLAKQLHYEGQFRHYQGTSANSEVSPAADSEYRPIKKLLVANRGKWFVSYNFFTFLQ